MTVVGSYSKGIRGGFDEAERLALGLVRPGITWVDADENRKAFIRYTLMRRLIQTVIGNASPNDGFKAVGDGASNDVEFSGGDGTFDGAGRIWVEGFHAFLKSDVRFVNQGATEDEASLFPAITAISGVGNEFLEDGAAGYVVNSLVGRTIRPDVALPLVTATVVSNTARVIETSIDLVAAGIEAGARYRVEMSTPIGSDRNDGVYLNVSLDEVDGDDLPSIKHSLGALIAAQFFAQVRATVEVHQGDAVGLPGSLSASYVDVDGFEHFRLKIADIERFDGVAAIAAPDVTDRRVTAANFTTFVKKIGDTFTGDVYLDGANIIMLALETVDGRDVSVDGAKLDTIDFTPTGIAAELALVARRVKGTDLATVTATTVNVSQHLRTKEPGGTPATKGVATTSPGNRVKILRSVDQDEVVNAAGSKLAGQLTEVHPFPNISGTWTFTNASFSVAGVGGSAVVQLQVGDIVRGPDSLFYTVATIVHANSFTIVEPFAGVTGPTSTPDARRWLLALVKNSEGTVSAFDPTTEPVDGGGSVSISWYYLEVFGADDQPVYDDFETERVDQVAAEVPTATESLSGKVTLAADLESSAVKVPKASDTRLGRVKTKAGATTLTFREEVEIEVGTGLSVALTDVGGTRAKFALANTAPGASFDSATPLADTPAGDPGNTGISPHSNHRHPLSSEYKIRTFHVNTTGVGATFTTGSVGFNPRRLTVQFRESGGLAGTGSAIGTLSIQQSSQGTGSGGGNRFDAGAVMATVGGTTWAVTQFTSAGVILTRTGGDTMDDVSLTIEGDVIP